MARPAKSRKAVLEALDRAIRPIYLLDTDRRIAYCNPACLTWLGVAEEAVVGQRLAYQSGVTPGAARWTGLCPPPPALEGKAFEGVVWISPSSSTVIKHHARFLALPPAEGATPRVLVVVGDRAVEVEQIADDSPSRCAARLHDQLLRYSIGVDACMRVDPLIGTSPAIKRVRAQVRLAGRGADRILIVGPAGCGHEMVARSIHEEYRHLSGSRLFPLECSLLDAELLQTALDAFIRREIEAAEPRAETILLLDADQLALDAQQALWRLMSADGFRIRTIATASGELVHAAGIRPDLAAALSTLTIRLPGLRERLEDLPLLAQWILERLNGHDQRQFEGFTPEAMDQLLNHPWLASLDELAEVVELARRTSTSTMIGVVDLPAIVRLTADAERFPRIRPTTIQLDEYLGTIERELMARALRTAGGNRAEAARLLGIPRGRLLRRLAVLGLDA